MSPTSANTIITDSNVVAPEGKPLPVDHGKIYGKHAPQRHHYQGRQALLRARSLRRYCLLHISSLQAKASKIRLIDQGKGRNGHSMSSLLIGDHVTAERILQNSNTPTR